MTMKPIIHTVIKSYRLKKIISVVVVKLKIFIRVLFKRLQTPYRDFLNTTPSSIGTIFVSLNPALFL